MSNRHVSAHRSQRLAGNLTVPGDKSIAHRVLILGSLARGTTFVRNVPESDDIACTLRCLDQLGVRCERVDDAVSVDGLDNRKYLQPKEPLNCGGSATTMRLLLGAIAGRGKRSTLVGNESLSRRPMARIAEPLKLMGAETESTGPDAFPPITISPPEALTPIQYELPVASAQVKTALILAGLNAPKGRTVLTGLLQSRDHTERFIPRMGGSLVVTPESIVVEKCPLNGIALTIPGDTSTAAFFGAAAALLPNSDISIRRIGTNPTRMGFFEALSWMGGNLAIVDASDSSREPFGDIAVKHAPLHGIVIHADAIPFLVDEVPLIMLLACCADGDTILHGPQELRVKESDRIACAVEGLTAMGADIMVAEDHIIIRGNRPLHGARLDPWGDHRMSMMFTIAAYAAAGESTILNVDCETKSCPQFDELLQQLLR
jgi:3-phosphoshikimate 1-carboxyvinyltransferase